MQEQRKTLKSSTPEEEGAAKMMCDEVTSVPSPMKFSLERREKWGEGFFKIKIALLSFDWK